jgi:hypothetical protein
MLAKRLLDVDLRIWSESTFFAAIALSFLFIFGMWQNSVEACEMKSHLGVFELHNRRVRLTGSAEAESEREEASAANDIDP